MHLSCFNKLSQPNPTPTQQQLNLTRLRLDSIIAPNPPTQPHPPYPTHPPHPPQTSHWSRACTAQDQGFSSVELVQLQLAGIATVDLSGASITSA